jgi:hypothetical protein
MDELEDEVPAPQSDAAILAAARILPDSWGAHGPNQALLARAALDARNTRLWQGHTFSGVTRGLGRVRWPNR